MLNIMILLRHSHYNGPYKIWMEQSLSFSEQPMVNRAQLIEFQLWKYVGEMIMLHTQEFV